MRLIAVGGKEYDGVYRVDEVLKQLKPDEVVLIDQEGLSRIVERWCCRYGIPYELVKLDGKTYRGAAWSVANRHIIERGADLCVAFPGGNPVRHMVKTARKYGIKTETVDFFIRKKWDPYRTLNETQWGSDVKDWQESIKTKIDEG